MKVELISYPAHQEWMICKMCTLVTVGKEVKYTPTDEWKHKILKARHSPIRELKFVFRLRDVPYWVSVHLCRHVHAQPYVKSQRNDRQNDYDRTKAPQDAPVDMMWSMNADELIEIAKKRLCKKASPETREVVEEICRKVIEKCPEFDGILMPACGWQGGICHEMIPCYEE